MTTNKIEAKAVKVKLEQQYADLSFGLSKDGDDWVVEARDAASLTINLPSSVDGVKVRFRSTGPISAL